MKHSPWIMIPVAVAVAVALIVPDLFIYSRYAIHWWPEWLSVAMWAPTVAMMLALAGAAALFSRDRSSRAMHTVGVTILSVVAVAVPKIVFALTAWATAWFLPAGVSTFAGMAAAAWVLLYIMYGATGGKSRFKVRRVEIESADLPEEFDGFSIVQLSDLHSGSWAGNERGLRKAVEIVNGLDADAVAFTGDLVNSDAREVEPFMDILGGMRARHGVYSVLGNHDYGTYSRMADRHGNLMKLIDNERSMGWRVLLNENVIFSRNGARIALAGVENSGNPPFPDRGDLPRALEGTDGLFTILLSHDPTHWRRDVLGSTDVQLTLSGHTHDMQFSFMGFSPARYVYPDHNGLYCDGDRSLFVNIGLGHLFPLRLGAWPEITLLTLRRKTA